MVGRHLKEISASLLTMAIIVGTCGADEKYDRARYELIVDRSPFGSDPLAVAEGTDPIIQQAESTLKRELRLCFLQKTESGEIRAGFQNLKASPGEAKSVLLMSGESFHAAKLIDIDLENATATLLYQNKPVTFDLSKTVAATTQETPQATTSRARRFGTGFRRTTPPQTQQQTEPVVQEPVLTPEEQAVRQAQVRENLRQYQMEVIRAGMPPLPIPLTQEMDDQLVQEGVLPPQ